MKNTKTHTGITYWLTGDTQHREATTTNRQRQRGTHRLKYTRGLHTGGTNQGGANNHKKAGKQTKAGSKTRQDTGGPNYKIKQETLYVDHDKVSISCYFGSCMCISTKCKRAG